MKNLFYILTLIFTLGCGVSRVGDNAETLDTIYPKFLIYDSNLKDTVEWVSSIKLKSTLYRGVNRTKKALDFDKVYAFQNKYGFYLKFPGAIPHTGRPLIQSWPEFFERILKGRKIDLFKVDLEEDTKRTGVPNNGNIRIKRLMAVSRDNYNERRLLTPNILKQLVSDNARAVAMVESSYKTLKDRELSSPDKVIEILNFYNKK